MIETKDHVFVNLSSKMLDKKDINRRKEVDTGVLDERKNDKRIRRIQGFRFRRKTRTLG